MASEDHEDISLDAAEYELGTLDELARARFARALVTDESASRALDFWREHLNTLGLQLTPVAPPPEVWERIETELDAESTESPAAASGSARYQRFRRPLVWQSVAAVACAAVVALAAVLFVGPQRASQGGSVPAYAAMIRDAPTGMSWLVTVKPHSRKMVVRAIGNYKVPSGKVLHAWVKPANGSPHLVGALPPSRGKYSMKVSKTIAHSLANNAELMVSMDNATASKPSQPQGRIMWKTPITRRTG